MTKTSDMPYFI